MHLVNLDVYQIGGDGNCLFRAIAHQAYGDEELHDLVRSKCMTYIKAERKYFKNYVADSFDLYIEQKSKNGVWGDDLEI